MTRTYEVFLKKAGKDEFRHAGALDASDPEMAVTLAREAYVRRGEGDDLWVVDRSHVLVADPDFVRANEDRPHRHNDGSAIAERRRRVRDAEETNP